MKIAISANGSSLDARVSDRFSTAEYLLIIDVETGKYEAVPNPVSIRQHGAGVQVIILAVSKGAKTVITGYCNPDIVNQLKANGVEVLNGTSGLVKDALAQFRKTSSSIKSVATPPHSIPVTYSKGVFYQSIKSSGRQFLTLMPVMLGVILLIGLFEVFIPRELLKSIFSGNVLLDTLWGACFGSIFAGNPINSYIIGGELLKYGISLFAITAFIVTWVTVGLVQLPAEISAFGKRFALLRNGLSFVIAIPIAIITVLITNLITRWMS